MLRIDMVLLVMLLQSLIVAAVAARGDQAQGAIDITHLN